MKRFALIAAALAVLACALAALRAVNMRRRRKFL